MALGYLDAYEHLGKEEEIGEEYFNYLASRSFFQDFDKNENGSIYSCKMHDMVHDFVQYLTNEEIVAVDVGSSENWRLKLSFKKAHHLMIINTNSDKFLGLINGIEKLRSLVITTGRVCEADDEALRVLFKGVKSLRLLDFDLDYFGKGVKVQEIPKEIKKLIHLKYLNLQGTDNLKELSEEMCELLNLQYLNFTGCWDLEKLPDGIGKLINLRYLYTDGCENLKYYPKGIGRLTSLRKLDTVKARAVDGNDVKEFSVGDLENLDNLRGSLDIRLVGNVVDVEEAKRAKLHKKIILKELYIFSGDWT